MVAGPRYVFVVLSLLGRPFFIESATSRFIELFSDAATTRNQSLSVVVGPMILLSDNTDAETAAQAEGDNHARAHRDTHDRIHAPFRIGQCFNEWIVQTRAAGVVAGDMCR